MTRNLRRGGKGLFAAGLVAALGFGAGQAFAEVRESQPQDLCSSVCRAHYTRCIREGGTDCATQYQRCLAACALPSRS